MERGGTKSFTLKVLQHLRSTLLGAGVDFHRVSSTHLCVYRQPGRGPPGHQGGAELTGGQRFHYDKVELFGIEPASAKPYTGNEEIRARRCKNISCERVSSA